MKIGILGATGFVGQNLMEVARRSHMCVGASRRTGVDARNTGDLVEWILNNKVTHLVNLAAECGGIGLNQEHPAQLWAATTAISHSVLEAARITDIEKLIMIGTVCSYPQHCPTPFKEEYLLRYGEPEPTNRAYGIAKLNALYGAQAYAAEYGTNVCCLIPVNMYGRYDNFGKSSHVIPAMIEKFMEAKKTGQDVTLWGTGKPTREFLHVVDFSNAVLRAIEHLNTTTFVNIGTGSEISIADLANLVAEATDFGGKIIWDTTKPDGQPKRCLDITRAKEMMGFSAAISLPTGLADTIAWYKNDKEVNTAP